MIADNLQIIRDRIAAAARRVGRDPDEITLLAVSKVKPASDIVAAYEAGQRDFGENYVQEFASKRVELGELPGAKFHLIGKLQSNKTRPAAELFDVIQTVDSVKIARRLNEQTERPLEIFLEVHVSGEEAKSGMDEADLPAVIEFVAGCESLKLRGLMGVPPWSDDPEFARPYFRRLKALAEAHGIKEISMGMSNDFEAAIEEGSTMVRVGTAIFGKRIKPA